MLAVSGLKHKCSLLFVGFKTTTSVKKLEHISSLLCNVILRMKESFEERSVQCSSTLSKICFLLLLLRLTGHGR